MLGEQLVDTPRGPMRLTVHGTGDRGALLLFHGAGSSTDVPVLLQLADRALSDGWSVARLDQPYRVAGRRAPAPAPHLDEVARLAVGWLRAEGYADGPLVLGGRSSGSRVACRISGQVEAAGVIALGFPLEPPGGRPSREPELDGASCPVLVVQGERDSFGMPLPARDRDVHVVAGADHVLRARRADGRSEADCVAEAVEVAAAWLSSRARWRRPRGRGARPTLRP